MSLADITFFEARGLFLLTAKIKLVSPILIYSNSSPTSHSFVTVKAISISPSKTAFLLAKLPYSLILNWNPGFSFAKTLKIGGKGMFQALVECLS